MAKGTDADIHIYQFKRTQPLDHIGMVTDWLGKLKEVADVSTKEYVKGHLDSLRSKIGSPESLECYLTFLPPRLISTCREGSLVPFFGSGLSVSSGLPTWEDLLAELGISRDFLSDPLAENDPLTQAELIADDLGEDVLHPRLQQRLQNVTTPSLAHHLLAQLCLPVYITTNYDTLFEKAWEGLWHEEIQTVTNDEDIANFRLADASELPIDKKSYLFKMHSCISRDAEHLILTRSDYRNHYRTNRLFFKVLRDILSSGCVMFVGFGHRDPEVSRLVEDMIYDYEQWISEAERNDLQQSDLHAPTLYSIQFDMRQKTPEISAARGIVAIRPATLIGDFEPNELRSVSLAVGLAELMAATKDSAHEEISLECSLRDSVAKLSDELGNTMKILKNYSEGIMSCLPNDEDGLQKHLDDLLYELDERKLKQIAGQGVYVTYRNGDIAGMSVPSGLKAEKRSERKSYNDRPYFRFARTFRRSFVSDIYESVYNKNSTFFLCCPLGSPQSFEGLLFAAAQPGAWSLPIELREKYLPDGIEFILLDSNGIAVVPPSTQYGLQEPLEVPDGEDIDANMGFRYDSVRRMSKRDAHISHMIQNIVPIGWDDDVNDVALDLRIYSMVADVPPTRWKLALSRYIPKRNCEIEDS